MKKYQVWYMRPDFFTTGIFGGTPPDHENLSATHIHLLDLEAEGLNAVFNEMQAEIWSPNGEKRELIQSKGLEHTSMSVGDAIKEVETGYVWMVDVVGFRSCPL